MQIASYQVAGAGELRQHKGAWRDLAAWSAGSANVPVTHSTVHLFGLRSNNCTLDSTPIERPTRHVPAERRGTLASLQCCRSPIPPSTLAPVKRRAATTPLADALARVGDRWTLLVVAALLDGPEALQRAPGRARRDRAERAQLAPEGAHRAGTDRRPALLRAPAAVRVRAERVRPRARRRAAAARRLGRARRRRASRTGTTPAARRSRRAGGARPAGSSSTIPMTTTSSTSEADTSARRCRRARQGRARTPRRGRSTPARTTRAAARPASCEASISRSGPKHSSACVDVPRDAPQASHATRRVDADRHLQRDVRPRGERPRPAQPTARTARPRPADGRGGRRRPAATARRRPARTPRAPARR